MNNSSGQPAANDPLGIGEGKAGAGVTGLEGGQLGRAQGLVESAAREIHPPNGPVLENAVRTKGMVGRLGYAIPDDLGDNLSMMGIAERAIQIVDEAHESRLVTVKGLQEASATQSVKLPGDMAPPRIGIAVTRRLPEETNNMIAPAGHGAHHFKHASPFAAAALIFAVGVLTMAVADLLGCGQMLQTLAGLIVEMLVAMALFGGRR